MHTALIDNGPVTVDADIAIASARRCELRAESLHFRYPNKHEAVAGIDLKPVPGILGLLGPNSAGKSSPMRNMAAAYAVALMALSSLH